MDNPQPIGTERTLNAVIKMLEESIGQLENKVYFSGGEEEVKAEVKVPMPVSKVNDFINRVENVTNRIRKVKDQLLL